MLAAFFHGVRLIVGRGLRETAQAIDRFGSDLTRDVAYFERSSRHRTLMPLNEVWPIHGTGFIAPTASLVGDVTLGNDCVVWYGAVLKGDVYGIKIGDSVTIGENSTVRTFPSLPNGIPSGVTIAHNVVIGAQCSMISCVIDSFTRVGAGTTINPGARIERGVVILPGSVITPGAQISAYTVWGGNPAHFIRDVGEEDLAEFARVLAEERNAGESQAAVLKAIGH